LNFRGIAGPGGPTAWPRRPIFAGLLVLALLLLSSMGLAPQLSHSAGSTGGAPSTTGLPAFPTPIRHVVTVVLENAERSAVLQSGPYETHLAATYAQASAYYAACHPSAPNYLSMTSGQTLQCGSDSWNVYSSTNVADLVERAGETWGAYMESMPTPCDTSNTVLYAVRHDPFVYYSDIVHNTTRCDSHVLSLSAWNSSVASGNIPNYAFISPNVKDDGHDTGVAYADNWLHGWLAPLINTTWFASTVFFLVYDEGSSSLGFNGTAGGNIYFAAVSPFAKTGFTLATKETHYDLLTTTEWLLGLGSTGHNDDARTFPPMTSLFTSVSNATTYAVSGNVTAPNGTGISNATVSEGTGASATTNANGSYTLPLAPGTYNLTASAAGYANLSQTVNVTTAPLTGVDFALPLIPRTMTVVVDESPSNGTAPLATQFSANVSGGSVPYSYSWNFGNGNTTGPLTAANVTQTYATSGVYNVTVDVTDASGSVATANSSILVLQSLLVVAPPTTTTDKPTSFASNATVQGGNVTYSWLFGDSVHEYGPAVTYEFPAPGVYLVHLWINDSLGGSSVQIFHIRVAGEVPPEVTVISFGLGGLPMAGLLLSSAGLGAMTAMLGWWLLLGTHARRPGWRIIRRKVLVGWYRAQTRMSRGPGHSRRRP
jgi:PKD repeat protein